MKVRCDGCDRDVPAQNAVATTRCVDRTYRFACRPCYAEWRALKFLYLVHPRAIDVLKGAA